MRERLAEQQQQTAGASDALTLSSVCEQMFEHCLAPNTMGDGTGCDNMTAIIVQLKHGAAPAEEPVPDTGCKRPAQPVAGSDSKRARLQHD